jgi:hypothetical protein
MSEPRAVDAARNNAAWCDAVCSAHGSPGELSDALWLSRAPTPPRYPNLVTLDPAPGPALAAVRELERALTPAAWAVKDSFAALRLDRAGFRILFDAEWIARPVPRAHPRRPGRWIRVRSEAEIAAFEVAWGESAGQPRIFRPALLARSDVAILAALGAGGDIFAGAVANRTGSTLGISNFFARGESAALRSECLDAAIDELPAETVVGYESGRALEESLGLGFRRLGSLRVWLREASTR